MKQQIIEFLIQNQAHFKDEMQQLSNYKNLQLNLVESIFRYDLNEQYDARIRQHIAFSTAHALGLPAEYVIIELEHIDLKEYLNV